MHFYIKYIEGPFLGKKYAVPETAIKYNFSQDSEIDKTKKYMCIYKENTPYKCQILLYEESLVKLQILIRDSKRLKNMPDSQLITASENELTDDTQGSTSSTVCKNKDEDALYNKHLSLKLERIENKAKPNNKTSLLKSTESHLNKENEELAAADQILSTEASKKEKMKLSFAKTIGIHPASLDKIINNVDKTDADDDTPDQNIFKDILNSSKLDKVSQPEVVDSRDSNKVKIMSVKKFDSTEHCEIQLRLLKEENIKLKADVKILKKENTENEKQLKKLKNKIEEEKTKSCEYMELNKQLQKVLLERFEEKANNEALLKSDDSDMDLKKNFYPVGYLRKSDNKIHVGRNIWLDHKMYSNVINQSKKPANCVGNILTAIFGIDQLQKGTLTGRQSNRNKLDLREVTQLDPVTVTACKDFYGHWLKTVFIPNNEDTEGFEFEFSNFNEYASKKISYLKRDLTSNKDKVKKTTKRKGSKQKEVKVKKKRVVEADKIIDVDPSQEDEVIQDLENSENSSVKEGEGRGEPNKKSNFEEISFNNEKNYKDKDRDSEECNENGSSETDFSPVEDSQGDP